MDRLEFRARVGSLRLPVVAAPMFGVSGPELVAAACRSGVIGAFPTANCRSGDELDAWVTSIAAAASQSGPWAANLIVHHSNARLPEHLEVLCRHRPPLVITSVGSPAVVVDRLHAVGAVVLSDVATMAHARKAVAAGADGLVLLTAGAGGQTGWANPFAFVRGVRDWFDGPVAVAGGIADGWAVRAAISLGADLAYVGTRFLATTESRASEVWKAAVVAASMDDVVTTTELTGLPTNVLAGSVVAARLGASPAGPAPDAATAGPARAHVVGHGVTCIAAVSSVARVVAELEAQYRAGGSGIENLAVETCKQ